MIDKVHFDVPGIIEADDVEALAGEGRGVECRAPL